MKRGIAYLPLHYGKAPSWLFRRMKILAREIVLIMVKEWGTGEILDRLSDPFWFQAFGCVLGFDWHSSGLTTTVCGALKEGLKDVSSEIGIFVCGGKGGNSRKTPQEIEKIADKRIIKVSPEKLIYASRMSAKVDSTALQDGYQIYHHCFIFTPEGKWCVIQQGMNEDTGWARRYHWLSEELKDFVCEPHKAICSDHKGRVLNLVAKESESAREMSAILAGEKPEKVIGEFEKIRELKLSSQHPVSYQDIHPENLRKILLRTYAEKPENFEKLLSMEGVGPKTIRALALISELIYGKEVSVRDPVCFSFAHGGKDGYPYPVNRKEYDLSIQILKDCLNQARIGVYEKLNALRRLSESGEN
ncbi:MAG: DUF763 domain-containing protein [Candidatus Omnitrophica bacterium]|nr:DUF763 domain-containing protein [Candidatus Omnitrophota bacterium]MCM8798414.1 DUF763 domain-containing protein [Candidatus Omnitrophota bacterium]